MLRFLCSHLAKDPILKPHEWWRKALSALALALDYSCQDYSIVILDEAEAAQMRLMLSALGLFRTALMVPILLSWRNQGNHVSCRFIYGDHARIWLLNRLSKIGKKMKNIDIKLIATDMDKLLSKWPTSVRSRPFTQGISKLQRKAFILLLRVAVPSFRSNPLKGLKTRWFSLLKNGSVVEFTETISLS